MEPNVEDPVVIQLPPHSKGTIVATANSANVQQLIVSYAEDVVGPIRTLGTLEGKGEGKPMLTKDGAPGLTIPEGQPATLTLHFDFTKGGKSQHSKVRKLAQNQYEDTVFEVYGSEDSTDNDYNDTVATITYHPLLLDKPNA